MTLKKYNTDEHAVQKMIVNDEYHGVRLDVYAVNEDDKSVYNIEIQKQMILTLSDDQGIIHRSSIRELLSGVMKDTASSRIHM